MPFAQLIDSASDGGYYFCGQYNLNVIVGKIDSSGNLQWSKQIGDSIIGDIPVDMVTIDNGNIVIEMWSDSGSATNSVRTYILSFDANGNHIFTKKLINPNAFNYPSKIIKDGNGFTLGIYNSSVKSRFLKLDNAGNKLNSAYIGSNSSAIYKTWAGDYLLIGPVSDAISILDSAFAYQGTVHSNPVPSYYGLIQISASSYLAYGKYAGGAFVGKINSQLQYEWANVYSTSNPFAPLGKINSAHVINNNSILFFGGEQQCVQDCYPFFLQIDTSGNVQNSKLIAKGTQNVDFIPGKSVYKNGHFVVINNEKAAMQPVTSFIISCMDTTFMQLCNAISDTILVSPLLINFGTTTPYTFGTTNDSLASDTLPIIDITISYGLCSDSSLFINPLIKPGNDFTIFPNPFNSSMSVTIQKQNIKQAIINIQNVFGQTVFNKKENNFIAHIK